MFSVVIAPGIAGTRTIGIPFPTFVRERRFGFFMATALNSKIEVHKIVMSKNDVNRRSVVCMSLSS
jgi:hypothetical protein